MSFFFHRCCLLMPYFVYRVLCMYWCPAVLRVSDSKHVRSQSQWLVGCQGLVFNVKSGRKRPIHMPKLQKHTKVHPPSKHWFELTITSQNDFSLDFTWILPNERYVYWTNWPGDLNSTCRERCHEVFDTIAKFVGQFKCRGLVVDFLWKSGMEEVEDEVAVIGCDYLWLLVITCDYLWLVVISCD